MRSLLRRAAGRTRRGVLHVGELTVDPSTRVVLLAGERVQQRELLRRQVHALAADPARVLSKDDLLRDVWGYLSIGATRTVDAHACRLRKKLGRSGRRYIVSVRGVGYKLTDAL